MERISYAAFYARWQAARGLVCLAMVLAPRGPAKALLAQHLKAYGQAVMSAIAKAKDSE